LSGWTGKKPNDLDPTRQLGSGTDTYSLPIRVPTIDLRHSATAIGLYAHWNEAVKCASDGTGKISLPLSTPNASL